MGQIRRKLSSIVEHLKREIAAGDVSRFLAVLESAHEPEVLSVVREQKLLLKASHKGHRSSLSASYKRAAERLLISMQERQAALNYVDFIDLAQSCYELVSAKVKTLFLRFPACTQLELFELAHRCFEDALRNAYIEYKSLFPSQADLKSARGDVAELSATYESALHELCGRSNELGWYVIRVLNEAARVIPAPKPGTRRRVIPKLAESTFREAVGLASQWEGIDYFVDKVSYGEWSISRIDHLPQPFVSFEFIDPALQLARAIGIKRDVVWNWHGQRKERRFLRELLKGIVPVFLSAFLPSQSGPNCLMLTDRASREMLRTLEHLDSEDDLLVASSEKEFGVLAEYMAAVGIRWYAVLAREQASRKPRDFLTRFFAEIPSYRIATVFGQTEAQVDMIQKSITRQAKTLPVQRGMEILRNPLFRLPDRSIRFLPSLDSTGWTADVRSRFLKGGCIADRWGKLWEEYIEGTLISYGWNIIGRGVKLRKGKNTLTDIDLLVAKADLVLSCQVKGLTGNGENTYAHWKNRRIILEGIRQAKTVAEAVTTDRDLIHRLTIKHKWDSPLKLQPLVLTNMEYFNGWNCDNIPVVGLGGLMSILRGARVTYFQSENGDQSSVGSQSVIAGDEATTEEFLRLIHEPLDWQIATEMPSVDHEHLGIGVVRFALPTFQHRGSLGSQQKWPMARRQRESWESSFGSENR